MKLWGGRFTGKMDPAAWALNTSLPFDQRLALQDVQGSIAWAQGLGLAGVLSAQESEQICAGLKTIGDEFENERFVFVESDEDIHTAVERRLGELIGPLGGKLHTGRSRNDQVATDFRLWLLAHAPHVDAAMRDLQAALIERAENDLEILMPGYTHLQRAQPILLGHWWLAAFWPLQRDRQRLAQMLQRAAVLPLGSGAMAGTSFPIDRQFLARSLGFDEPCPNSIDGVSDRDFAAEFLFISALAGAHLSKLAEAMVLFTSAEFGFFELSDAFSTGSSLMPQKKNPDVFELARGKTGPLIGLLTGLLTTIKGLPSTYDKDLQEDKAPVFSAYDTLMALLPVLANALRTLSVYPERMRARIDAAMMATDLADYLAAKAVPFRQAHALAGAAVQLALRSGKPLDALSLDEFQSIDPIFDQGVYRVFDPLESASRRSATGGSAPSAVKQQLALAKEKLTQSLS